MQLKELTTKSVHFASDQSRMTKVEFCVDNTAVVKVLWSGTSRDLRDSVHVGGPTFFCFF